MRADEKKVLVVKIVSSRSEADCSNIDQLTEEGN